MNELAKIDPPQELQQSVSACVRWSEANAIADADGFQATAEHLKEIKRQQAQADAFFDPLVKQAYQLHKDICQRKKLLTEPLAQSERIDKSKMIAYQRAEEEKAEAERRRLQADADERARREREALERRAAAAKKPETQERLKEQAAAVAAPVIAVAANIPKAAGISTREVWKASVVDVAALLEWVVANKRFDLITPNQAMLDGMAKALKGRANVPGVQFKPVQQMAARG